MMSVLVDTSVWVEYFQGSSALEEIDFLIDESLLVTNELIQAELLPPLLTRGEDELVGLLPGTLSASTGVPALTLKEIPCVGVPRL